MSVFERKCAFCGVEGRSVDSGGNDVRFDLLAVPAYLGHNTRGASSLAYAEYRKEKAEEALFLKQQRHGLVCPVSLVRA